MPTPESEAASPPAAPVAVPACPVCKKTHPDSFGKSLDRLKKAPRALAKALRGMKPKHYDRSYGAGKWSIRQILCHLRDCELVYGFRYRKMLAEDNAVLVAFDQDKWADQTAYAKQDGRAAAKSFATLRDANLELLKVTAKDQRGRSGVHAEYGAITVEQLVKHIVAHDQNHLGQIELARSLTRKAKRK